MSEKKNILVVEDNNFVRMQILRYLAETGAHVLEASEGGQALEIIREHDRAGNPVSLIVADVRMEPVDGFEFIRSIRGLELDIPVILVTGDNNPDLLEQAGSWGVSAVMIKPVQKDRLVKTALRIIESHNRKG
ncbi:MAG: hypothetical protein DI626_03385 [Micavibrio aeruginosavorus]|uniref:Response regulatory domain-containing protein n=1 Tax=Micavibrio aeruginosavorus TaxID=349221 RepID=A0A2W5BXE4_9BACT|nr:MAG: hypothetical protein DI626_03385 [Micavibrio aeruginosavorus]